jgi:hypothetical protein
VCFCGVLSARVKFIERFLMTLAEDDPRKSDQAGKRILPFRPASIVLQSDTLEQRERRVILKYRKATSGRCKLAGTSHVGARRGCDFAVHLADEALGSVRHPMAVTSENIVIRFLTDDPPFSVLSS